MSNSGVLIKSFEGDPRLSDDQIRAMDKIAQADPDARIMGMDYAMRPVIQANIGVPRSRRQFTLNDKGRPAVVSYPPGTTRNYVYEAWSSR